MKHLFRATKMGWDREQEAIWFDADSFSVEQALAEFTPYQAISQKGYPFTGYEYDGEKYHDVTYLGKFEDGELPHNDSELMDSIIKKGKEGK